MINKILKTDSENFKKIQELDSYLTEKGIELHTTLYNGIIYKIGDNFYKYGTEGQFEESVPVRFDGNYILCDQNGNTDFYNR